MKDVIIIKGGDEMFCDNIPEEKGTKSICLRENREKKE
jgi:hypothetical protein